MNFADKGGSDDPIFNQSAYLGQDIWEEKLSLPEELVVESTSPDSPGCSAPALAAILQEPLENDFEKTQPKPVRKRPKQYVPDEEKNERYWEKRYKNNLAARKSREAKRLRDSRLNSEQIEKLEKDKKELQEKLDQALRENKILKQKLGMEFSTFI